MSLDVQMKLGPGTAETLDWHTSNAPCLHALHRTTKRRLDLLAKLALVSRIASDPTCGIESASSIEDWDPSNAPPKNLGASTSCSEKEDGEALAASQERRHFSAGLGVASSVEFSQTVVLEVFLCKASQADEQLY